MKTIHHVLDIAAGHDAVRHAITTREGLAGWWSTKVATALAETGALIEFTFEEGFNPDMQITHLDTSSVEWKCIGGHEPWADNTFRFELHDLDDGRTRLRFWQHDATELSDDEYGIYNFNWGYYLQSLLELVTTGTGRPHEPSPS